MNFAWIILGCLTQMSAVAADGDAKPIPIARYLVHDVRLLPEPRAAMPVRESPFALAIKQAAKKGVIELGVEASTEILIQCQKSQSTVLTTPFMRSDSQQAHCYRF